MAIIARAYISAPVTRALTSAVTSSPASTILTPSALNYTGVSLVCDDKMDWMTFPEKRVFVTVGTTCFDDLIAAATEKEFMLVRTEMLILVL